MDLRKFSERNLKRCEAKNGFKKPLTRWSLSDWALATLGELGEAANVGKKLNRIRDEIPGNSEDETEKALKAKMADELADTFIYLDLLAQRLGKQLSDIVPAKFAKTSAKIGYIEPPEVAPVATASPGPSGARSIFLVQDSDRPLFVLASSYAEAIDKWRAVIASENDGETSDPEGVQKLADATEVVT